MDLPKLSRGDALLHGSQVNCTEQIEILVCSGILGREKLISVEDRVRPSEEAERLSLAGHARAPSGKPYAGLRKDDASHSDEPHELEDVDGRLFLERGAGHRHEAVDRHALGRRIKSAEDLQHA